MHAILECTRALIRVFVLMMHNTTEFAKVVLRKTGTAVLKKLWMVVLLFAGSIAAKHGNTSNLLTHLLGYNHSTATGKW